MTIQTAPNLEMLAATHGITITTHTGGEKGRWYSNTRTISIRRDLGWVNTRCTLAHELGHAICGHDSKAEGWFKERQEHEADTGPPIPSLAKRNTRMPNSLMKRIPEPSP